MGPHCGLSLRGCFIQTCPFVITDNGEKAMVQNDKMTNPQRDRSTDNTGRYKAREPVIINSKNIQHQSA